MYRILPFLLTFCLISCTAQKKFDTKISFTTDLKKFEHLNGLKKALKDVEIIALGENTHGLGGVFKAKAELVQFLHQELGFDMVLFESGYGDGALAWEQFDRLSATDFTKVFSSNFYYRSKEILDLVNYAKQKGKSLMLQGFDCQPQQDYLIRRMSEIIAPIDSVFAKSVTSAMKGFNKLYQYEQDKDSTRFYQQRDRFISFLDTYDALLMKNKQQLLELGTTMNELEAIQHSSQIFRDTYAKINFGEMMGWPVVANIRDRSLFQTVQWFKKKYPKKKIIIWAQNSHIENQSKSNYTVNWMGHYLKKAYGDKYFSIGSIVYSGKDLRYSGVQAFEHQHKDYLAYHLRQTQKECFVLDVRNYQGGGVITQPLLGMESNGSTGRFVAKDRFDGLLFIKFSDAPQLLKK